MNKQVEANLSMIVSKALGGFNMNACLLYTSDAADE